MVNAQLMIRSYSRQDPYFPQRLAEADLERAELRKGFDLNEGKEEIAVPGGCSCSQCRWERRVASLSIFSGQFL